jgi:hypothetical protein
MYHSLYTPKEMTASASPHELSIALNTVQFLLSSINHRYLIRCAEKQIILNATRKRFYLSLSQ